MLREHELDEAKEALAARTAELTDAEALVARATEAARAHARETETVTARERGLDEVGRAVADTLRSQRYLAGRQSEAEGLGARIEEARERARAAADAVTQAREVLAAARAGREAVERHHDRWQDGRRRHAESRAEAEAEDIVAARHGRKDP